MSYEIGGEYHLFDFPGNELSPWPERRSFFASGRAALYALYRRWAEAHVHARLWLPDYFCSEVVSSLRSRRIPTEFYPDNPQRIQPEFDHLRVSPGDMVLAVNYFGIRSGDHWSAWRAATSSVALVEDHTHDPQSLWSQSSTADFAFASLRKTLPIPDGAVAWSPREIPLPLAAPTGVPIGSSLKLAAMLLKCRYLDSGEVLPGLKQTFLEIQKRGEQLLADQNDEGMSAWSLDLIHRGTPATWRSRREYNVRSLFALAPGAADKGKPLFLSWPAGHCPFNAVYVFQDELARERVRHRLIEAQVYTPVHWPLQEGGAVAVDLSRRILTIPVDFRCNDPQIHRIATLLNINESTVDVKSQ